MKVIIPSIIAKNQKELEKRIKKVKNSAKWLQLDVMDGKFVKNSSINFDFSLPKTKCRYEAHLMVKNSESWIEKNAKKVNTIIFPIESAKDPDKLIKLIKNKKKKTGMSLNPRTKIDRIKKYLKKVDLILFMTVNPGKYGAKFLPSVLKKIKELRKISKIEVEVDGGINPKTIGKASKAGANRFVVGSYLQKAGKVNKAVRKLEGLA
jgi:ribulose-phosphate 3-epimerase